MAKIKIPSFIKDAAKSGKWEIIIEYLNEINNNDNFIAFKEQKILFKLFIKNDADKEYGQILQDSYFECANKVNRVNLEQEVCYFDFIIWSSTVIKELEKLIYENIMSLKVYDVYEVIWMFLYWINDYENDIVFEVYNKVENREPEILNELSISAKYFTFESSYLSNLLKKNQMDINEIKTIQPIVIIPTSMFTGWKNIQNIPIVDLERLVSAFSGKIAKTMTEGSNEVNEIRFSFDDLTIYEILEFLNNPFIWEGSLPKIMTISYTEEIAGMIFEIPDIEFAH